MTDKIPLLAETATVGAVSSTVSVAILNIDSRFPNWRPTPVMAGYAKAVAHETERLIAAPSLARKAASADRLASVLEMAGELIAHLDEQDGDMQASVETTQKAIQQALNEWSQS